MREPGTRFRRRIVLALIASLAGCLRLVPTPETPPEPDPAPPTRTAPDTPEIRRIRQLYREINGQRLKEELYVTSSDQFPEGWRKTTREALERAEEPEFSARVLGSGRQVRKVIVVLTSPAGDWQESVEHYFYPSGRLAFRFEEHLTYGGPGDEAPYVLEDRRYFAEDGTPVRGYVRAFARSSGREVDPAGVQHTGSPTFRSVGELPFWAP